jgi:2-haloacid dehalogenase
VADLLAFDVNETLLDLAALDEPLGRALGDAALRPVWFGQMLQLAFVGGLTGAYVDFATAQRAALEMLARRAGRVLRDEDAAAVAARMRALPAHPEVPAALTRLRDGGLRLVALTNSTLEVAEAQLAHAGIRDRFEAVASGDEVRALKPRPEAYALVTQRTGVPLGRVRLVAAHAWDVSGALAAGARAAFVARPGAVPSPLGPQPDLVVDDLDGLADVLLGA